jgi:FKBP-type peptidyl-prolyl cis-trans isomerase
VEFDSTYPDGQPVEVGLDEVVPGWGEGLQLMQEGAQWQIFIPPHLGYGERGPLAGRAVILEIELLKVLGSQVQSTARPTGDDSP